MTRRELFKQTFMATIAAAMAPEIGQLIKSLKSSDIVPVTYAGQTCYINSANQIAVLKELYSSPYMRDLVYKENPFLKLI